jgi:hypothetical protein
MRGTERQVKWAGDIKTKLLTNAQEKISYYESRKTGLAEQGKSTAGADKVISRYKMAIEILEKEEDASTVIDRRTTQIESSYWFHKAEQLIPR